MKNPARIGYRLLLVALFLGGSVQAQPSTDAAMAESLFQQGKKLLASGNTSDACPKLEESVRLETTGPSLFLLAECLEKSGRTASAWARWREASDLAKQRAKTDKQREAAAHATRLEPRVPRLRVNVSASVASLPGLEVKRDGFVIGRGGWGEGLPADPGPVKVEAFATGKKPWSRTVTLSEAAETTLEIDRLEDATAAVPPPPPPSPVASVATPVAASGTRPPSDDPGRSQRLFGWVAIGAGGVGLTLGTVFMLSASSKQSEIRDADAAFRCVNGGCDTLVSERNSKATVGMVGLVAGGVLLLGGIALELTAPSSLAGAPGVAFQPLPGGGVAFLKGHIGK